MTEAKDRRLATLSATVWSLRADGVPLPDILKAVRQANREWEPSDQPAFVIADEPPTGMPGKRHSTADPLTEHDIAERLSHAILRVHRIMQDVDNLDLRSRVKLSRYLVAGALPALRDKMEEWL